MEEKNWLELLNQEMHLKQIQDTNQYTEKFGLSLSEEDTKLLVAGRSEVLRKERRVEFGDSILPKIIYTFCDSDYIFQANYRESLLRLQEIFYLYKNEMLDEITDDELLEFMREQFDTTCFGDFEYLEGTCLDVFAQAVRAGYKYYQTTGGKDSFEQIDIVKRWDRELFLEVLEEMLN